jgi:hypothetical protein
MSWVAAAVVGGAIIGGVASNQSAKKAANAAKKGADTSASTQLQMYDQSRADLMPWMGTGANALKKLAALNGVQYSTTNAAPGMQSADNFDDAAYIAAHPEVADPNQWYEKSPYEHYQMYGRQYGYEFPYLNAPEGQGGDPDTPDYSDFYNSPDYQFSLEQGLRATKSNLASRGLSNSGRAMKELTRFGQGLASQQLNNYRNSLAAMAGVGQTATTNVASLGGQTAAGVGQSYQNAADARASGYIASGNAISGGINNAYGTYALMNMMNQPKAA